MRRGGLRAGLGECSYLWGRLEKESMKKAGKKCSERVEGSSVGALLGS